MAGEGDRAGHRLARGCRCFAAWRDGAVAGYGWLTRGPEWIGEVGIEIRPGPDEGYVWNCVTLPAHRRQGVFRALVSRMTQTAADAGLRRLWIAGLEGTAESALPPLGFEPFLRIQGGVASGREEGFSVLGLQPGEHIQPGPPRRH